jgi:hypothetical protein
VNIYLRFSIVIPYAFDLAALTRTTGAVLDVLLVTLAEVSGGFAGEVSIADTGAFVEEFFTFTQAQFHFEATLLEVESKGD